MDAMRTLRRLVATVPLRNTVPNLSGRACSHIWVRHGASPVFAEWMHEAWDAQLMDRCPHCGAVERIDP